MLPSDVLQRICWSRVGKDRVKRRDSFVEWKKRGGGRHEGGAESGAPGTLSPLFALTHAVNVSTSTLVSSDTRYPLPSLFLLFLFFQ